MRDLDLSKLPDQSGRHILVTGGTNGLGRELILRLASLQPSLILFTGRNQARADELLEQIRRSHPHVRAAFISMDLASLASVHQATLSLIPQLANRLDLLVCNAGIMAVPAALSPDGYEIQWATNHLGHALLIKHLLPILSATAETPGGSARIVSLTSEGLGLAPFSRGIVYSDLKTTQDYGFGARWVRYGQSKLANRLYVAQLAEHYPHVLSVAVHPGVVGTELVSSLGFWDRMLVHVTSKVIAPEDGYKNMLWAAAAEAGDLGNGSYYRPVGEPGKQTKWSESRELAEQLWDWTQKALEQYETAQ